MRTIGKWITEALDHRSDTGRLEKVRKQVLELSEAFPLYAERRRRSASQQPAVVS